MQRLVLASNNQGKLVQLRNLLANTPVEVVAQVQLGVNEIEETGLSFVENALLKARHAARITGLPTLADDSGLCVSKLHGAPGLYSARYAGKHGDDLGNNTKLLRELEGVPDAQRAAFFICMLALISHADDPAPQLAEARWYGRILHAPRGTQGFGYDPLFLPDGQQVSAAELDSTLKNRLSHRARALARLLPSLSTTP